MGSKPVNSSPLPPPPGPDLLLLVFVFRSLSRFWFLAARFRFSLRFASLHVLIIPKLKLSFLSPAVTLLFEPSLACLVLRLSSSSLPNLNSPNKQSHSGFRVPHRSRYHDHQLSRSHSHLTPLAQYRASSLFLQLPPVARAYFIHPHHHPSAVH